MFVQPRQEGHIVLLVLGRVRDTWNRNQEEKRVDGDKFSRHEIKKHRRVG